MKLILAHDDAPEGLPGHIGVVRDAGKLTRDQINFALVEIMTAHELANSVANTCGKLGEREGGK